MKVTKVHGGFELSEPTVDPLDVGNLVSQELGRETCEPYALYATLDLDSVSGLKDAFQRQKEQSELDVVSQWRVGLPESDSDSPIVLLYLDFPEVGLSFNVRFVLDLHKRSLAVAARTGRVLLFEPELTLALKTSDPAEAMANHLSIGLNTSDTEPLRRVLHQRFDLPLQSEPPRPQAVPPANARAALDQFRMDAGSPDDVRLLVGLGTSTLIVVVDQDAEDMIRAQRDMRKPWGHWASMQLGPYSLARLDVLDGDDRRRSWIFADPPQELIRAASSGPHLIVVVTRPLPDDAPGIVREIERSSAHFPVDSAPEAMRALLR